MVLGEFLIMLDVGFVGYLMAGGKIIVGLTGNIIAFWILLVAGVLSRYGAEKFKG